MAVTAISHSDVQPAVRSRERLGVRQLLRLLEYIAGQDVGVTPVEIAEMTGKSLNTAYDLLSTLTHEDYVVRDRLTNRYMSKYKLMKTGDTPGGGPPPSGDLLPLGQLQQIANALNHRTGCRVYMLIQHANYLRLLNSVGHQGQRGIASPRNLADALHATALGKMLLAMLADQELASYLANRDLQAYTPATITDQSQLRESLRGARAHGLAVEEEEYQENLACVAAPFATLGEGQASTRIVLGIAVARSRFLSEHEELSTEVSRAARTYGPHGP